MELSGRSRQVVTAGKEERDRRYTRDNQPDHAKGETPGARHQIKQATRPLDHKVSITERLK
jgi:hypothetical protein